MTDAARDAAATDDDDGDDDAGGDDDEVDDGVDDGWNVAQVHLVGQFEAYMAGN